MILSVGMFVIWPNAPGVTATVKLFTLVQENMLAGLTALDLGVSLSNLVSILLYLALYVALRRINRSFALIRGEDPFFDRIEAVRQWLLHHEQANGRVYGGLPQNADEFLKQACPIVASYGARDRTLKGAAARLEGILTAAGIEHDVKEYPDTDHAFMNDHLPDRIPWFIQVIAFVFGGGEYNPASAQDSRNRITTFFDRRLKSADTPG